MQVTMKHPQVVVTAKIFVEVWWSQPPVDRGIRRRFEQNFVRTPPAPASAVGSCAAQSCRGSVPRLGVGHLPMILHLPALHTTHMPHPTTSSRTNALSSTQTRYMLGDAGAEIDDDAGYLRSWPVTSIAPLSHPPPHHHPPNAGNEHEITHAHTPRARSLFISRAHRHRLEFPLRAAAEFRFPCCWNDFSCFWRAGVAGAFGQFWPFPTTRAFRRAYNT